MELRNDNPYKAADVADLENEESIDYFGVTSFGLSIAELVLAVYAASQLIVVVPPGVVRPQRPLFAQLCFVIVLVLPFVIIGCGLKSVSDSRQRLKHRWLGLVGLVAGFGYLVIYVLLVIT